MAVNVYYPQRQPETAIASYQPPSPRNTKGRITSSVLFHICTTKPTHTKRQPENGK
ncbi:hypothetical protein [Kingella oralis]|uniref:hypothetical protein n=1 Tax=Kingella oralis TaxID=505 RepID=UPI002D7EB818|nr:hypothetical protein [Kingella oralis]